MGSWYEPGVALGLGVAVALALSGALVRLRAGALIVYVLAAIAGGAIGLAVVGSALGLLGVAGALGGSFGALQLVRGTLRRGGTESGTTVVLGAGAIALGALALVPLVGYVLSLLLPALGLRLRRRAGARYAGLRTLARD